MALTVAQLAADPALGLTLLAGRDGVGRELGWAHTSELVDPTPWTEPGGLLLTMGQILPMDEHGLRAYAGRLAEAGVAALAFDTGTIHDEVPAALVAAGDELGLPVLRVPPPTPFIAIERTVVAALNADRVARATLVGRHQERLSAAAVRDGVPGLVGSLATILSADVAVITGDGRVSRAAGPDPAGLRRHLDDVWQAPGSRAVSLTHTDDAGTLTVQSLGPSVAGNRSLVLHAARAFSTEDRSLIAYAVTLLSLVLRTPRSVTDAQARLRTAVLRAMLAQAEPDPSLAAGLGLEEDAPIVAVSLGWPGGGGEPTEADEALRLLVVEHLRRRDVPRLAEVGEEDLLLVLPASEAKRVVRDLRADLDPDRTDPGRTDQHPGHERAIPLHPVGLSDELPLREIRSAVDQARWAREAAADRPSRRAAYGDLGVSELLLRAVPRDRLAAVGDAALAPLDEHDGGPGGPLEEALAAYLEAGGAWAAAADALGIHRHTLRKRVDLAARLLGRDLDSARTRTELWLALAARRRGR